MHPYSAREYFEFLKAMKTADRLRPIEYARLLVKKMTNLEPIITGVGCGLLAVAMVIVMVCGIIFVAMLLLGVRMV